MKNFYIFLDIDGVLYDWDFIIAEIDSGRMKKGKIIDKFKPESVNALNFLIKELQQNYNVTLVISSTWRINLAFAIKTLKDNGLQYNNKIDRTPIYAPEKRGEQILDYLKDKESFDFVIIDDEMFDYLNHFNKEKIIKCEIFHCALSLKMVKEFLSKIIENEEENLLEVN